MVSLKRGKLGRADKRTALQDEKNIKKEANIMIRETQRDMFNPAKMSIRHIDQHLHETDQMLSELEKIRGTVRQGHQEYHNMRNLKSQLNTQKKRLRYAKKADRKSVV